MIEIKVVRTGAVVPLYDMYIWAPEDGTGMPEKPDPKDVPPFGGLESITEEEILKNIRDYPYVMGKLKDC